MTTLCTSIALWFFVLLADPAGVENIRPEHKRGDNADVGAQVEHMKNEAHVEEVNGDAALAQIKEATDTQPSLEANSQIDGGAVLAKAREILSAQITIEEVGEEEYMEKWAPNPQMDDEMIAMMKEMYGEDLPSTSSSVSELDTWSKEFEEENSELLEEFTKEHAKEANKKKFSYIEDWLEVLKEGFGQLQFEDGEVVWAASVNGNAVAVMCLKFDDGVEIKFVLTRPGARKVKGVASKMISALAKAVGYTGVSLIPASQGDTGVSQSFYVDKLGCQCQERCMCKFNDRMKKILQ